MQYSILAFVLLAPAPKSADPALAIVTGKTGDRDVRYVDSLGTTVQGMAIILVGNSSFVRDGKEEDYDVALKKEHIRVQFPKPYALRAIGDDEQKTYEVAEIVIRFADARDPGGVLVKASGKYYHFAKYDGALWVALQQRVLGR
jgi:hypothetical protein